MNKVSSSNNFAGGKRSNLQPMGKQPSVRAGMKLAPRGAKTVIWGSPPCYLFDFDSLWLLIAASAGYLRQMSFLLK